MERVSRDTADGAGLQFSFKPPERTGRVVFEFEQGEIAVGKHMLLRDGELWLERARAFAMHGLGQLRRFRTGSGRGRYSLFTGDIGAALLAAACLDGNAALPGIDDL